MPLLSGIVLAVWILIFIQTIVNLLSVPRLQDSTPRSHPFVSIVVPARNEARTIERSIRAFLAQDYEHFEVIVVNDRSTDATGEILRSIADPRLVVIDGADTPDGWLGKPWALEQGRRRAQGELLLFADADLVYAPQTLRAAVAALESQNASLLMLFPRFEMHTLGEQIGMPMLAFFGLMVAPLWWSQRSRNERWAIGGGSGNLVQRGVLERCGGFEALKDAVVDDISLAMIVRRNGAVTRVVRADDSIAVRMYHNTPELIEGFTKNLFAGVGRSFIGGAIFLALFVTLNFAPYALAFSGDAFAIATVVLISVARAILFRSLRYRLDNALFLHPVMCAFWAYIFLRSMWITGVRNELRWRGRTYDAARTRFGAER